MKMVFVDTGFLVGMSNPRDQWHAQATIAQVKLDDCYFVTTESVLTEVLTYFCEFGPRMRFRAPATVDLFLANPDVEVVPISHEIFLNGFEFYKQRPDKSYSLTDCISMNICRERGITDVLSHDHHFTQEGLTVLM